MKRVIQVLKAPHQWRNKPPGLGDFVRGACHLMEVLHRRGVELRIDVSQTEFAGLIEQDASIFHAGGEERIAQAEEYFVDPAALRERLTAFLESAETELYLCTNVGAWHRLTLPPHIREFIRKFYRFADEVELLNARALRTTDYEVLSVRCGDEFFGADRDPRAARAAPPAPAHRPMMPLVCSILERSILPHARSALAVTSDSHELKCELAERFGLMTLPHRSQHGAFGLALPVAMDLCLLKNSRFNYHINAWVGWWSGFSHYTSLIFNIPSMNFRAPDFVREEITASGELLQ
jgi:hypothetical protein